MVILHVFGMTCDLDKIRPAHTKVCPSTLGPFSDRAESLFRLASNLRSVNCQYGNQAHCGKQAVSYYYYYCADCRRMYGLQLFSGQCSCLASSLRLHLHRQQHAQLAEPGLLTACSTLQSAAAPAFTSELCCLHKCTRFDMSLFWCLQGPFNAEGSCSGSECT